jgi:hypothetical protein
MKTVNHMAIITPGKSLGNHLLVSTQNIDVKQAIFSYRIGDPT